MVLNNKACYFIALLTCFTLERVSTLNIVISPNDPIERVDSVIEISCKPDGVKFWNYRIAVMEIIKDGGYPIVVLRNDSKLLHENETDKLYKVEGDLNENVIKSYLKLKIMSPTTRDSGRYTCLLYHQTDIGFISEERASKNITVQDFGTIKNLNDLVTDLSSKVTVLEATTKRQAQQIVALSRKDSVLDTTTKNQLLQIDGQRRKVTVLEATVKQQSQQIAGLRHKDTVLEATTKKQLQQIVGLSRKVSYAVAFSVLNGAKQVTSKAKKILILPDILLNLGNGYNKKTGVFTAPTHGLYAFNVFATTNSGCVSSLYLTVKNVRAASLYTVDKSQWDQSSMSSTNVLNAGDKVFLKMHDSGCIFFAGGYTAFTGFLIKQL